MPSYPSPNERQLRAAFRDHGVNFVEDPKSSQGRDAWVNGLRAATVHHTAGKDSLAWLTHFNYGGCNGLIRNGRYNGKAHDGEAVIVCWGSAWHSGAGGPWRGVAAKDSLHLVSWGIEVESMGTRRDITDAQVETTARMLAALVDLGMPLKNIHRHADWTDGTGPVGGYPLPTKGRKNDTNAAIGYTTEFWKDQTRKYRGGEWDGVVPSQEAVQAGRPKALWRLQSRLFDLGYRKNPPVRPEDGPDYPSSSMARFREKQGWEGDGFGDAAQRRLFGEVRP